MYNLKRAIPNAITLTNLFLGCIAIVCAFNGKLAWVPLVVFLAGIADFLDGLAARILKVSSNIGTQLDSLADMVTFGVVPGVAMFQLLALAFDSNPDLSNPTPDSAPHIYFLAPAFLITVFSALRLAKFNVDERQTSGFLGLATPACTAFVLGMVAMLYNDNFGRWDQMVLNEYLLYAITIFLSYLLIAEIPMFSLKFKSKHWKGNELRWLIIIIGITLIAIGGLASGTLIISLYILMSLFDNYVLQPRKAARS